MKVFNIFWSIAFLLFAGLQYNDPDPYVWIPIYLYASVLCWLAARARFYRRWYVGGILVYLVYAVYLFFTKDGVADWVTQHDAENIAATMQASKPWIEDTREFFGLFICIAVLGINYVYAKKRS
ncbi:transmembrane 220 family protein [Chitinophaga nivalis]|uniref:Transmembrane 220 family protein n=1 Tax=Chitinophaga nivalis TaxID=2991709 RepID=A0ABT3IU38_9BACT|nr:transmembrane 220 family protein [Chitinophaga nivalis]MCW3463070.1 transmembrane 220 family protein [Chitinophaga nivalis]MCW3487240.1 transmembrane 220 family protein [Chitinophaga nivalis]